MPSSASRTSSQLKYADECFVLTASYIETFVENAALGSEARPHGDAALRAQAYRRVQLQDRPAEPRLRRPATRDRSCERALTATASGRRNPRPSHPRARRTPSPCQCHGCPVDIRDRRRGSAVRSLVPNSRSSNRLRPPWISSAVLPSRARRRRVLAACSQSWLTVASVPLDRAGAAAPGRRTAAPAKAEKAAPPAKGEQAIVVLVNDEPITAYEIQQRAAFLAAQCQRRRAGPEGQGRGALGSRSPRTRSSTSACRRCIAQQAASSRAKQARGSRRRSSS